MNKLSNDTYKHSFKPKIRENLGLTVYNCGFQKCESGYTWGPALRDHYLIHYVTAGKGTYKVNNNIYEVHAGMMFAVFESSVVSYSADEKDPWEYYWVGFNGADAERLVKLSPLRKEAPVLNAKGNDVFQSALLDIYRNAGSGPADEARMVGYLYLFLSHLIALSAGNAKYSSSSAVYVENALKFIRYNYSNKIDICDIAKNIGVSRSHLYRIFVRHLSMSPNEYLAKFRINEACALLRNSSLSIGEIANSVGFDDQLYFSRVFKKYKGVAPSRYVSQTGQHSD
ncbi:AraC family transcriptional regulator [Hydrogenoanaerobacterium sp.]|uniref:AraC family transcriptional regulator n=1 Tax=Hydrogenoanaerobacterium sp. TaxID=2953763 RepID=UPI00289DED18|nr:AraC family transcriptional regulator [Hydrogenoanaerobacterium sp.]